jgi:hypothetical protein
MVPSKAKYEKRMLPSFHGDVVELGCLGCLKLARDRGRGSNFSDVRYYVWKGKIDKPRSNSQGHYFRALINRYVKSQYLRLCLGI